MILPSLLAGLLAVVPVEVEHDEHSDSGHYHHEVFEVFLGGTYEDGDHGSENGLTIGLTWYKEFFYCDESVFSRC